MMDTQNYVLDPTHPEVQRWLERLYRRMTLDWGFTYQKLDFTRAVVLNRDAVFHKNVPRAEAYRMGIEAIRRGAGPDAYILNCGGLYGPSLGLVNGQRTGSDVRSWWPEKSQEQKTAHAGRAAGPGELVAPLTVKQNVLRFWMNSLWHNDPDALMVRRRVRMFRGVPFSLGLLTDDEATVLALNEYFAGGQVGTTEPLSEIDRDRLGLLRHIVPSLGRAAVPRDLFGGQRFPSIFDTEVSPRARGLEGWHTVAILNWWDEPSERTFVLDDSTVGEFSREHDSFVISEFWSGRLWEGVNRGESIDLGAIPPHAAVLLRIAPRREAVPTLLHSSGHFSMGGSEIRSWRLTPGRLVVGIEWNWDYPLELTVRSRAGRDWKTPAPASYVFLRDRRTTVIRVPGRFRADVVIEEE
jgi:hypothetical protein